MTTATASTQPEIPPHLLAGTRPCRENSSTSLLILSQKGRIVHGNPAWFQFAEELQLAGPAYRLRGDYLAACLDGWGRETPGIKDHGVNVAAILRGGNQQPAVTYPCMIAGDLRWFSVAALPLDYIPGSGILVTHHEVTGDVLREEALARRAFFDALTELPNYALFNDRVNQAIAQSCRSGEPLATMFIDLDDFKSINDSYGHLSGNRVLRDVARRLSSCLRECDTVARLGGDEFGMLLPGIGTRKAAINVAEKILAALAPRFDTHEGAKVHLTASIGIAFCPTDGMVLDTLMHRADQAMYQSKEICKTRFHRSNFGFCEAAPAPVFRSMAAKKIAAGHFSHQRG